MSKKLILIPKKKYDDLLQLNTDIPRSIKGSDTGDQPSISAPDTGNNSAEFKSSLVSEENKSIKEENKQSDVHSTYIKMKPAIFAKNSDMHNKKWLHLICDYIFKLVLCNIYSKSVNLC